MCGSCALKCFNAAEVEHIKLHGISEGKSTWMIYDRHPNLQSKWDKAFWARKYYVETIGNVTESAIKKYIEEQSDESRKEENSTTL